MSGRAAPKGPSALARLLRRRNDLAGRLALVLSVALLPIGVMSVLRGMAMEDEIRSRLSSGLLGATLRVAAEETGLLRDAQGVLAGLAAIVPSVADDPVTCAAAMRRAARLRPEAALVAFLPNDGLLSCTSVGMGRNLAGHPDLARVQATEGPGVVLAGEGAVTHQPILALTHPVFDAGGRRIGDVILSLPQRTLGLKAEPGATPTELLSFWTFDAEGRILSSSTDPFDIAQRLPQGAALSAHVGRPAEVFAATSRGGNRRSYAVTPLLEGQLYLMGAWRKTDEMLLDEYRLTAALLPVLMALMGMVSAAWAAERLVGRPLRRLAQAITRFAEGDRSLPVLDMAGAPTEIDRLASDHMRMAAAVTRNEAMMEDTIRQKEILLREVHHRVNNNLQMIGSIMNLQLRHTRDEEARRLLRDLHDRVMGIASIHRHLYGVSDSTEVDARALLTDVVRQVSHLIGRHDRGGETRLEIAAVALAPAQAVSLALMTAELVTALTRDRPGRAVTFRLRRLPGGLLRFGVKLRGEEEEAEGGGLRGRIDAFSIELVEAFARRLRADLPDGTQRRPDEVLAFAFRPARRV